MDGNTPNGPFGPDQGKAPLGADLSSDQVLLREAANSLPIGFVMFNAARQIVVANATFLDLYGHDAGKVGPGMTLAELLRERNRGAGITEEELAEKVVFVEDLIDRREAHTRIDTLPNGRRIKIRHRPLPDGGWVGTHEDVTEQEAAAERLRYLAHHDVLTGLKSRAYFWDILSEKIGAAEDGQSAVALHLIDLDHFKTVNDTYGHEAGDRVLQDVAQRLLSTVRRVDVVARLGGDEFAIVQCQKDLTRADAESLARRVVAAAGQRAKLSVTDVEIGVSLGIAFSEDFDGDVTRLVNAADHAMYRAKRAGRNGYAFADATEDMPFARKRSP